MGIPPTERLTLKRQHVAATASKKESVSLSLLKEVDGLEVEEDFSTMATLFRAKRRKQIFEVQTRRQMRGLVGAVLCESRDLGNHWPQWDKLLFE